MHSPPPTTGLSTVPTAPTHIKYVIAISKEPLCEHEYTITLKYFHQNSPSSFSA